MKIASVIIAVVVVFQTVEETATFYFSAVSCAVGMNFISLPKAYINYVTSKSVDEYVFFYLHTKENPDGQEIVPREESLKACSFNFNRPTKIITHGYRRTKESDSVVQIRDALLKNGDYNIITVDWSKTHLIGKILKFYPLACAWVPKVGTYIAELVDFLDNQGMDLKTTTLIGHSLGAHVMGIAGYKTTNKVNLIVGLDPAGPAFESKDPDERLSTGDANTVIAIHTNEGDCGISQSVGHYDFYVNGGNIQPGCITNSCAHARAYEIFAESIYSENGFYGKFCPNLESARNENCTDDVVKMNEKLRDQNAKEGIYYFKTNEIRPFALGK